jgi:4-hydroxybenzoate polyprenyltransferase
MKLYDSIIFSLCVGFFIIAVHLTMTLGIIHSYWVLMLSVSLFLYYNYRKLNRKGKVASPSNGKKAKKAKLKKA